MRLRFQVITLVGSNQRNYLKTQTHAVNALSQQELKGLSTSLQIEII